MHQLLPSGSDTDSKYHTEICIEKVYQLSEVEEANAMLLMGRIGSAAILCFHVPAPSFIIVPSLTGNCAY